MWDDACASANETGGQDDIEMAEDSDYEMWLTEKKKKNIGDVRIIDEIKRPMQPPSRG